MARASPDKKAKSKTKRLTPAEQHARFVETAKEVNVDESPEAMDRAFKRLDPWKKALSDASH